MLQISPNSSPASEEASLQREQWADVCSHTNSGTQGVAAFLFEGKSRDDAALLTISRQYSYGELQSAALSVAAYLQSHGAAKGERAILASDNSFFWAATYLGILYAGLICVPLAPATPASEFEYIVESTDAKFAFLQSSAAKINAAQFSKVLIVLEQRIPNFVPEARTLHYFSDLVADSSSSFFVAPELENDDLAALIFTSGSSGRPKGVMVSHGNIIANTNSIIAGLSLIREDRIMTVLPFHYCFGTSLLHTHLRVGGMLVLESRFMYPEKVLDRMIETACTGFAGVPSHFQILLRSSSIHNRRFPDLRYVQQAGGYLAPKFISELQEALPSARIFVMYGQTEATARLSCLPPEYLPEKIGSIGRGIPGVRLRVLSEAGEDISPGETGEIVAEGENVTHGYWRDPEETATSFRNRRLHTGDLATVDSDGFIYILDRAKDFLKCGGKRVGCRQLEQQILACENALEVAVIGIPDEILGEAVKAFVVPRAPEPNIVQLLRTFCVQSMEPSLVPREIVILESLPKNENGKVSKHALRQI